MELYPYQKETKINKEGVLKLKETGKNKVLIVTTPSKRDSGDMTAEAEQWCGSSWLSSLSSFTVLSWHGLAKWERSTPVSELKEYVFGFDEIAKASAGVSSGMGKAFLRMAKVNEDWAGFTGTPGDTWLKFYPYFQACGLVRNKTWFMGKYANVQTYKGFPEIVGYRNVDELKGMWKCISTAPDTSAVEAQLPTEVRKVKHFKKPTGYNSVIKTRKNKDGELLDTTMALCHYLRQMCFTKDKRQWISDFIEGLGTNAVFFCNYIEEEDTVCEIAEKVLPKGARIWRIDGKHHEIPTAKTIGKYDIVVAHYASGGEALNLQFMNYFVAVSPNYSYSVSKQAEGRIRRLGQKRNMFFYYLKADDTIEEAVFGALRSKSTFSEKVWCLENKLEDKV